MMDVKGYEGGDDILHVLNINSSKQAYSIELLYVYNGFTEKRSLLSQCCLCDP